MNGKLGVRRARARLKRKRKKRLVWETLRALAGEFPPGVSLASLIMDDITLSVVHSIESAVVNGDRL